MKRIILLFAAIAMMAVNASAQSSFFKKCEGNKEISTIYISKAMLDDMGSESVDSNISAVKDKINNIQIITSESGKGIKSMESNFKKFCSEQGKNMETLMKTDNNGTGTTIYRIPIGEGICQYVISARVQKEYSVIFLEGALKLDEISRLAKSPK